MSGAVKAGLLFALVGLLFALLPLPPLLDVPVPIWTVVLLLRIVPLLVIFGPTALVLDGLAGYLGARWSAPATVGRGVLAGGLAGTGVLLGIVAFFETIALLLTRDPDLRRQLMEQFSQQWSNQGGDPAIITGGFSALIIAAGVCAGLMNLLLALGVGALGGLIASRQSAGGRRQV